MLRLKRTFIVASSVVISLVGLIALPTSAPTVRANPGIIRVDASAPGPVHDGNSWVTAYTNLQTALDNAVYGDEIWVAKGVYKPTNAIGPLATFNLKPGVAMYGGFGGYGVNETLRTQRNWAIYRSVLSGDLDNNDINADGNFIAETWNDIVGNNAYHVVVAGTNIMPDTVLDGFTITGGNGSGQNYPDNGGGGMYISYSSPTLSNVIFSGNQASGYSGDGGGLLNDTGSPILFNITFSGNAARGPAGSDGGGMNSYHSSPILTNVTFSNNQAASYGGGICSTGGNPILTNVIFNNNQAWDGGGMLNYSSNATLTNVTFNSNKAQWGGGLYNYMSTSTLVNSILWGDTAVKSGSEIYNNTNLYPSAAIVTYSDVQGGWAGTGNVNADPLFVSPTTGNYHLRFGSPAIDSGNNLSVTVASDRDGYLRKVDVPGMPKTGNGTPPIVDMGAYELQIYGVTITKAGNGGGRVTSLPAGIDCGSACSTIFNYSTTVVTLTATSQPATAITATAFAGWSGDVVAMNNPLVLAMVTTKQITATFNTFTITARIYLPLVNHNSP